MSAQFNTLKKFYNEYINDDGTGTFPLLPGQFNSKLTGNVGELIKLTEVIDCKISINEVRSISITYNSTADPTYGTLTSRSLNWVQEGLWIGAVVDVVWQGTLIAGLTVGEISGQNNSILNIPKAALLAAGLTDGQTTTDLIVYLASPPLNLIYKYGVNTTDSNKPNYQSPYDNNENAYYVNAIPTTPATKSMTWVGREIGSNMGSIEISFITTNSYWHQYQVDHIFRIPFYKDGQSSNIINSIPPAELKGRKTYKYGNGFWFSGKGNEMAAVFEDIGGNGDGAGNVGYYGENFAGRTADYGITNYTVTNSLGTGKIEATVTNTVTFSMTSSTPIGFGGGETIILQHSRLPIATEYANKTEAWDDIWLFDSIRLTEGNPPSSNGIFSNAQVVFNAITTELDVSVDIDIPTNKQGLIGDNVIGFLSTIIATQNLADAELIDKSSMMVRGETYSKDTNKAGIISNWQPWFFEQWDFDAGAKQFTNFDGYDGDLLGMSATFDVDVTSVNKMVALKFHVALDNGTTWFPLKTIDIPLGNYVPVVNTYQYQYVNNSLSNGLNLPFNEVIGRIDVESFIPAIPTTTQSWRVKIGFEVPWQEWIENLNVPTSFLDALEPNNNRNNRTSNYSGVSGYTVKAILQPIFEGTPVQSGPVTITPLTAYDLFSDASSILPIDDPGASTFSATWFAYDTSNNVVNDLFNDEDVLFRVDFDHALGIAIPVGDLQGFMAILETDGSGNRWYLSTSKDYTNNSNKLKAANVVTPTNTIYVEIESIVDKVTLICKTNHNNLTLGQSYIVYARLGYKL